MTPSTAPAIAQQREEDVRFTVDRTMWRLSDATMTVRALTRLLATSTLVVLALTAEVQRRPLAAFVWLLLSNVLSLVHAARLRNLTVANWLDKYWPRAAPVWRAVFTYPTRPHINLVGVVEITALIWAAAEVGAGSQALPLFGTPSAFAGQPIEFALAAVLISVVYATVVANIQSHIVWYVHPRPREAPWKKHELRFRRFNSWYGWIMAPFAIWLLWPYSTWSLPDEGLPLLVGVSVTGPLVAALAALVAFMLIRFKGEELLLLSESVTATTRVRDSNFVHASIKSAVHIVMNELPETAPETLRDAARLMAARVSATERALNRNELALYRNAGDVIASMTPPGSAWARYAGCVVEDLGSDAPLHPTDAFWMTIYVSDLFTNAAKADAEVLHISLRSFTEDGVPMVEVEVLCDCGIELNVGSFTGSTSMRRMVFAVKDRDGDFMLDPGNPHTFIVRWPAEASRGGPSARRTISHD